MIQIYKRKNLYHNVDMLQERGFIVRNSSHEVEVIHELCKLAQGDASLVFTMVQF